MPEVRIIQNQEEQINPTNIDNWEAEQLLRKYGYQPEVNYQEESQQPDSGLTFEEMVAQENAKRQEELLRIKTKMNEPKPITFHNSNYTEIKYATDEDTGFGFKIEIVSDMKF